MFTTTATNAHPTSSIDGRGKGRREEKTHLIYLVFSANPTASYSVPLFRPFPFLLTTINPKHKLCHFGLTVRTKDNTNDNDNNNNNNNNNNKSLSIFANIGIQSALTW